MSAAGRLPCAETEQRYFSLYGVLPARSATAALRLPYA